MAMGGLTPLEAIRAGTWDAAVKLGLQSDIGALKTGMLADLIILDANPLDDIYNLDRQTWIVKNGFVFDAESMTQVWPSLEPLEPFFWMPDEDRVRFRVQVPARIGG
jgi:adenine deaminase